MDNRSNSSGAWAGTIAIVYCDQFILAVCKPAGLPTLPDGYNPQLPHLKSALEPEYGRLWIVHRLDRETSGLVVLARTAAAHRSLNGQFDRRQVSKRYHALVCGAPDWQEKTVHLALRANGDRRHRTIIDETQGKPAETGFQVLERLGDFTSIEACPHTGRTHQIRAHLAEIGLPILGDTLYGGIPALALSTLKPGFAAEIETDRTLIQRCALHAKSLDMIHPDSNRPLHLEAAYPEDFDTALAMLRRYTAWNENHE